MEVQEQRVAKESGLESRRVESREVEGRAVAVEEGEELKNESGLEGK